MATDETPATDLVPRDILAARSNDRLAPDIVQARDYKACQCIPSSGAHGTSISVNTLAAGIAMNTARVEAF